MPIARLRGAVEETGDDWVIVGVGGIGVIASVPARTAASLSPGATASLHTHLHVREDALQLYAFATADELRLFEQLIGVSGVGPRAALGLLSALDATALAAAIVSGDATTLRRVPGVGQKTAERIVLDLRDRVTPPADAPSARPADDATDRELVAALMGLGYTQAEAADASARLAPNGERSLEERVREALSLFAR
jgi:Holliday junction DNA helicase RuvA